MNNYQREMLIGSWFLQTVGSEQEVFSENAVFNSDGSFEFTFTTQYRDSLMVDQVTEFGDWGLVGNIHFTMTKSELFDNSHYEANLCDADNYHAYRVLLLNSQFFEYQHVVTNEVFTLRRVIENFGHD